MHELVSVISRERALTERMLYRVANVRNLLIGGQARFLGWASDEVADAAEALRDVQLTRATIYQIVADRHQLPDTFEWEAVIAAADDTDAALLRNLRNDLGSLGSELNGHLAACREMGEAGLTSATAALAQLQGVDVTSAVAPAAIDPRRHVNQTL